MCATISNLKSALTATPSLWWNALWAGTGNVIYAACQWLMLITIAKLTSPTAVGEFALGLVVTTPLLLFLGMGLRSLLTVDIGSQFSVSSYMRIRVYTVILFWLILGGTLLCLNCGRNTKACIGVIGLYKGVEACSDVLYGLFQRSERMDWVSHSLIIRGSVSALGLWVGLTLTHSLIAGLFCVFIAWLLVLVIHDVNRARNLVQASFIGRARKSFLNPSAWREDMALARAATPVGVGAAITSLNGSIPRYAVEHHLGSAALGVYSALSYPFAAGAVLIGSVGTAAMARMATYYTSGDRRKFFELLNRIIVAVSGVAVLQIVVAWVAGAQLLRVLYTPEYAQYTKFFISLTFAAFLFYIIAIVNCAIAACGCLQRLTYLLLIVTACVGVLSWVLVERYTLFGAPLASIAASIVQLGGSAYLLRQAFHRQGDLLGKTISEVGARQAIEML